MTELTTGAEPSIRTSRIAVATVTIIAIVGVAWLCIELTRFFMLVFAALVLAVKDGRPGDGMAAAVTQIGSVLAEHFPRSDNDTNELPDRVIEL